MADVIHTRRYPGTQEEAGYAARTALDDVLAWFLADGYTDDDVLSLVEDTLETLRDDSDG